MVHKSMIQWFNADGSKQARNTFDGCLLANPLAKINQSTAAHRHTTPAGNPSQVVLMGYQTRKNIRWKLIGYPAGSASGQD